MGAFIAKSWTLKVSIPKCYEGLTKGLCGNFDGQKGNELVDKSGTSYTQDKVVSWAQTWFLNEDEACSAGPAVIPKCTKPDVFTRCGVIKEKTKTFAGCHSILDPESYYENCVFDECRSENICGMYEQYADECLANLPEKPNPA